MREVEAFLATRRVKSSRQLGPGSVLTQFFLIYIFPLVSGVMVLAGLANIILAATGAGGSYLKGALLVLAGCVALVGSQLVRSSG